MSERKRRGLWLLLAGTAIILGLIGIAVLRPGGGWAQRHWTPPEVLATFEKAGLDVSDVIELTPAYYGQAPMLAEAGLGFNMWLSAICLCGEEPRARVMTFRRRHDLETTRAYYEALEQGEDYYAVRIFGVDNVLVVMSKDVPPYVVEAYRAALLAEGT